MSTRRGDNVILGFLLFAVLLLVFGTNLQGVLLPLLGHKRGAGMVAVGLYSSGWSTGFVLACIMVGRMLHAVGPAAAFSALASLSCLSVLLLWLLPGDVTWIGLRVVIGFCYGSLSAMLEGWLIGRAGTGVAFASYMMVGLLASLAGTLSLDFLNPVGRAPFVLMGGAVLASMVPILFNRAHLPLVSTPFRADIWALIAISPLGALGCVGAGLITGALGGLGPVLGMMDGLGMVDTTFMLAANTLGGVVAYAPVGFLTERMDRHWVMVGIAALGVAVCAPFMLSPRMPGIVVIALLGLLGVAQYPLYGVSVGIANAQSGDRLSAQVASELLLLFGLGTIAGPLIAAPLLQRGFGWMLGFIALVFAGVGVSAAAVARRRVA